ncbi:hypothetical protein [uncultured Tolumonas sp.]|uniref:hypothetical protein n=1 Tax=uncultured Tolumonas sp. TaxID=263765 RepID=UPI002A0A54F8|nr:hypothetical protein [uncultured Tolumonas sp.]
MLNMRSQSVNVNRNELISALKANLAIHQVELESANRDYKELVINELHAALDRATHGDFSKVEVSIKKHQSHEKDFVEIIEMMEMSVDETINLDSEAFRAYFKMNGLGSNHSTF